MTIRNYIIAIGIVILAACYIEQIISILETGRAHRIWTALMWALTAAVVVAALACKGIIG